MKKIRKEKGSITLEACMVVPMFITLMLLINGIFIMFMGQQIVAHALVQSAKSLAFDPYAAGRVSADEENKLAVLFVELFTLGDTNYVSTDEWHEDADYNLAGLVKERFAAYVKPNETDADALLELVGVHDGLDGINFSESKVENGVLTVKIKYTQDFVFNLADAASFEREMEIKIKLFQYLTI